MMTTIDWKEVKRIMIDRNIDSFAHLSRLTGIHKNSMGRGGAFTSPTLDKLAGALECHPCKLIKVEGLKEE
jgi:DNA-binding Xre family transcriptional regulator